MTINNIIRELRRIADMGIVNAMHDTQTLREAADLIEMLDERVSIVYETEDGKYSGLLDEE